MMMKSKEHKKQGFPIVLFNYGNPFNCSKLINNILISNF